MNFKEELLKLNIELSDEASSRFDLYYKRLIAVNEVMNLTAIIEEQEVYNKHFLDSLMIVKALDLSPGQNEIRFVCRTSQSGVQTLSCYIYLWHYTSKVIITDVDGTITKSDILGQVLPFFGKDWSHPGVTALFRNLYNNGYKIVYLTARAIGQSAMTKSYLNNIIQNQKSLPPGPLFMSPDGIFTSLRREVIEKKTPFIENSLTI